MEATPGGGPARRTVRGNGGRAVFAVVYRWRLLPGREAQFVDGWERVTRAIRASCGSFGSRLHRRDDGTWLAYARWPDERARARCQASEPEGRRLMREAVAEDLGETRSEIVSDLLDEPRG